MASRLTGIRALLIIAVYWALSAALATFGVPAWIVCAAYFAALFAAIGPRAHLVTLCVIFAMYGLVTGAPESGPWTEVFPRVLADSSKFPLRVLMFMVVPMMFFTASVDPYQLSRDLARLPVGRLRPILQLIGSIRLALFTRLAEIETHLTVRGISAGGGLSRFRTVGLWTVPLLAALITEAANRPAYCRTIGIPFPPVIPPAPSRVGGADIVLGLGALALGLVWLLRS